MMRTIICAMCGRTAEVSGRAAKYCSDACRAKAKALYSARREERRRERQILEGCRPEDDLHACDPPEKIAVCLSCPLPECRQESRMCPLHGRA